MVPVGATEGRARRGARRSRQVRGRDEVSAYPAPPGLALAPGPVDPMGFVVPLRVRTPYGDMSLFSVIATFGAPADVTLSELAVETFFPMDEATEALLRDLATPGGTKPDA